jgi:vacuolar iron transporter family protein
MKITHAADTTSSSAKLNKLRAAVLGANDGIVSISSVVIGVAGATANRGTVFTAGSAALVAGALAMAVGEFVSVSSQSDAEKSYIEKERQELKDNPEFELGELAKAYEQRGVSPKLAAMVAKDLTAHNALQAHLHTEFNLDASEVSSPVHAAVASFFSFALGGIIPFLVIILAPAKWRVMSTVIAVAAGLTITGYTSAQIAGTSHKRAVFRLLLGGTCAMLITYFVGKLFGTAVA